MKNLNDVISSVDDVLNSAKKGDFDELLAKTKAYAEIATKKSAEKIEISKKKIDLFDAKTKLAKAYEKFGMLQFSAYEGEDVDEDELDNCTEEIIYLKSRVEYFTEEIQALKNAQVNVPKEEEVTVEEQKSN